MISKLLIIATLIVILYCLGSGLYYLVKDSGKTTRTVKALSWRIGLSLVLFLALMFGFMMGWIQPHSI